MQINQTWPLLLALLVPLCDKTVDVLFYKKKILFPFIGPKTICSQNYALIYFLVKNSCFFSLHQKPFGLTQSFIFDNLQEVLVSL